MKSNVIRKLNSFEVLNKDKRGKILHIAKGVDVLRIFCNKGSKRAAHYHIYSSHLCVLLSGAMTYYEKPTESTSKPIRLKIKPGDYFFTDSLIDHLMVFNEKSVFDCYSFGSREKQNYENDLVKLDYDLEEMYNNWK